MSKMFFSRLIILLTLCCVTLPHTIFNNSMKKDGQFWPRVRSLPSTDMTLGKFQHLLVLKKDFVKRENGYVDTNHHRRRSRRDIKGELISPSRATHYSPYNSIVYVSIGCTGTLISNRHVLTAAHCIYDGKSVRKNILASPLKVGFLQKSGRFHRIKVARIFLSSRIKADVDSRLRYDYAVLKLVKPHTRKWVNFENQRESPKFVNFSSYRRRKKRKALIEFSNCFVIRKAKAVYLVLESDCPSEPGSSGAPIFSERSTFETPTTLGIVSAAAVYKSSRYGSLNVTVIKRFTEDDIARVKEWMKM